MKIEIENTEESIAEAIEAGITTPELVAAWLENVGEAGELVDGRDKEFGLKIVVVHPDNWHADDGNAEMEYTCASGEEAAQEYGDSGDWGDRSETMFVKVAAWREGVTEAGEIVRIDEDTYLVTIEAEEPDCIEGEEHDWQSPYELLGGMKENPGVWGNGGGVIINQICMHCGCKKTKDTWAQGPSGEQGLTSVKYEEGKYTDEVAALRGN